MKIKELREISKLSQKEFSNQYHIPLSTLQSWESNTRVVRPYVELLLEKEIKRELLHKEQKNQFLIEQEIKLKLPTSVVEEIIALGNESEQSIQKIVLTLINIGLNTKENL